MNQSPTQPERLTETWTAGNLAGSPGNYSIDVTFRREHGENVTYGLICAVESSRMPDQLEKHARLIAAAPELRAACKDLLWLINELEGEGARIYSGDRTKIEAAEKALAKAGGAK